MHLGLSATALVALAASALAQQADAPPPFNPILTPDSKTNIVAGSPCQVTWNPTQFLDQDVNLILAAGKDSGTLVPVETLTTTKSSAGSYSWQVKRTLGHDAAYGLKMVLVANESVFQWSQQLTITPIEGESATAASSTANGSTDASSTVNGSTDASGTAKGSTAASSTAKGSTAASSTANGTDASSVTGKKSASPKAGESGGADTADSTTLNTGILASTFKLSNTSAGAAGENRTADQAKGNETTALSSQDLDMFMAHLPFEIRNNLCLFSNRSKATRDIPVRVAMIVTVTSSEPTISYRPQVCKPEDTNQVVSCHEEKCFVGTFIQMIGVEVMLLRASTIYAVNVKTGKVVNDTDTVPKNKTVSVSCSDPESCKPSQCQNEECNSNVVIKQTDGIIESTFEECKSEAECNCVQFCPGENDCQVQKPVEGPASEPVPVNSVKKSADNSSDNSVDNSQPLDLPTIFNATITITFGADQQCSSCKESSSSSPKGTSGAPPTPATVPTLDGKSGTGSSSPAGSSVPGSVPGSVPSSVPSSVPVPAGSGGNTSPKSSSSSPQEDVSSPSAKTSPAKSNSTSGKPPLSSAKPGDSTRLAATAAVNVIVAVVAMAVLL